MDFRQLLPTPRAVDELELLAALRERPAPAGRPYTAINFVASVDGRATVSGRSGPLGDDGDHAMFHGLREQFDAVLAGTRTLALERYGRILGNAERRERRAAAGLDPEPLACIVSRSGKLPEDLPLLQQPEARVAIFTSTELDTSGWQAQVEVVLLNGPPTLGRVLSELRERFAVDSLLCEGGPTLFSSLVREGVADELFLTVSPTLVGGGLGLGITAGDEFDPPQPLELLWALERAGSLYLRYRIAAA